MHPYKPLLAVPAPREGKSSSEDVLRLVWARREAIVLVLGRAVGVEVEVWSGVLVLNAVSPRLTHIGAGLSLLVLLPSTASRVWWGSWG